MIDAQVDTSNGTEQTVIQQARALIQNAKDIVENQSNKVQMLIQVFIIWTFFPFRCAKVLESTTVAIVSTGQPEKKLKKKCYTPM